MSQSFLNFQSWQVDMRRNVYNVIMINHIGGGGRFPEVNKLLCCIFHANNVNIVYCSQARSQPYASTHVRTHCKGGYAVVQIKTSTLYVVLRKTPEKLDTNAINMCFSNFIDSHKFMA